MLKSLNFNIFENEVMQMNFRQRVFSVGLCKRFSSVKPALNPHQLFSNGAAGNTQSRSSLTS